MRLIKLPILEQLWFPEGNAIRIPREPGFNLQPGQYLLAAADEDILPTPLFLQQEQADTLLLAPVVPSHWQPGMRIHVQGPLGAGFNLSLNARHVALAGYCDAGYRLLPLMQAALQAGQTVTFFLEASAAGLPQSVEVLPIETLSENLAWADYLALDLVDKQLPEIISRLSTEKRSPLKVEALIRTPMPCGGIGNCGLCTIRTKNGIKHACEDGPVFEWSDLVED